MELVRGVSLVAATVTVGLMAGVFFAYAVAVMPGLGRTDDRTFVGAYQAIDRAIINPVFLATFLGALVLTGLAGAVHLGEDVLPWVVAAFVLYLAVFVITVRANVPLNDAIKAAGDPDRMDLPAVRKRFDEARWVRWNVVRTMLTSAALGCLAWALATYGRLSG